MIILEFSHHQFQKFDPLCQTGDYPWMCSSQKQKTADNVRSMLMPSDVNVKHPSLMPSDKI
uniref:Uncharacterized protein n=1 Tax=Romanomermis culicivorax TaxID=13658 RepID=A0A915KS38_ROMCU